jgi:hypothetical protein
MFFQYKKLLLSTLFSLQLFSNNDLIIKNNNNLYNYEDKIEKIINNNNLIIFFENPKSEFNNFHKFIILSKMNNNWKYAIDNNPINKETLYNFNNKKIYPLEFFRMQYYNYFDLHTLNLLYNQNIKIIMINKEDYILEHIENQKDAFELSCNTIKNNIMKNNKIFLVLNINYINKILPLFDKYNINYQTISEYEYTKYQIIDIDTKENI